MVGTNVAEKRFVWKFIDEVSQGVQRARNVIKEAADEANGMTSKLSHAGSGWSKYGDDAKKAASETSESLSKSKADLESYHEKAMESVKGVSNTVHKYSDQLKGIPTIKTTNFQAKIEDTKLDSFARKVHDVPKEKSTLMNIKDAASNRLLYIKLRLQELPIIKQITVAVHDNASGPVTGLTGRTKQLGAAFSGVKTVMTGTFLGNAALQGINAIGGAMGGLIKTGWDYNTEQQTMIASWHTLTGSAIEGQKMVDMTNKLATSAQNSTAMVNQLNQTFYAVTNNAEKTRDLSKAVLTLQDAFGRSDAEIQNFSLQWSQMVGNGKASAQDMMSVQTVFPKFREELLDYERKVTHNKNLTMSQMNDMMSKGKITSDAMNHVLLGMGHQYKNATNNFAETLRGMIRTAKSAAPRILGPLMQPLTNAANPILKAFSKWMADPKTEKAAQNLGKKIQKDFASISKTLGELTAPFKDLIIVVGRLMGLFASGVWKGFSGAMKIIWDTIKMVADAFGKLWSPIDKSVSKMKGFGNASKYIKGLGQLVGGLAGSLVGLAVEVKVATGVFKAWRAVLKAVSLAQEALNLVMSLNPIGLVIVAVAALMVAAVALYAKCKPFRNFVNGLAKGVVGAIKTAIKWLGKAGTAVGHFFTGKTGWQKNLAKKFAQARKEAQKNAKEQQKIEQEQQKQSEKRWQKHWKNLQKGAQNLWKGFKKGAQNGMKQMQKDHQKWSKQMQKSWSQHWRTVTRIASQAWRGIRNGASGGMKLVHSVISSGMSKVSSIWHSIWTSLKDFFVNIWDAIKQAAQDGMNAVISVINAGIGAIDKVWSFFTGHGSGIGKLGKVHFAQGGIVHRSLSVVNDGPGDDWKELMQFPDGSFGMAQDRNWTGFLPVGTRIYSGPDTRKIMNMAGIDHYATGGVVGAQHFAGGGIVSKIASTISNFVASVADSVGGLGERFRSMEDFLEQPVQKIKGVVENAVGGNYSHMGHWGELAHGEWDKITDGMKHWVQHTITQFLYSFENKQLSQDMMRAGATINKLRPSDGFFGLLWQTIMSESGGRSIVQQVHDVNSGGNEAAGVLQYTPGTFAKYALPGHSNRFNPFDEILAFFNNTDWLNSIGSTIIRGVRKIDWLHSGPQGGRRDSYWPMLASGGEIVGMTGAILGDNPEHHEFVINPYAPTAEPLLEKALATTAAAQGSTGTTTANGSSKLDQMVQLLAELVGLVGEIDPDVYLDGQKVTENVNHRNAKQLGMIK